VEALQDAMDRYGQPGIFNTDQGVQFTSGDFIDELAAHGVRISMDGKGRYLDNIFIERLWRSLKYEEVFIKAYASSLSVILCARHNRRQGAYYAEQSEESGS
jgi:putative transposase